MRNMIDMTPFTRSTIGFDQLFDQLEAHSEPSPADNYPPYDIEKIGEDQYRVVLAVAGFTQNELAITVKSSQLTVIGRKADANEQGVLYRGIGHRPFQHTFRLADFVVVKDAKLSDGLLTIDLEREVPEAMKPRRIPISQPVAEGPRETGRLTRLDRVAA